MKILHVVHNYHPSVGGTQYLFQNISERLVATYNDEVTVYTTDSYFGPQRKQYNKVKEKESIINGVKVIRFSYYKFYFHLFDRIASVCNRRHIPLPEKWKQFRNGPTSAGLKKALYNNEFDVVCASASDYSYMLYPLFRQKGLKPKPFVFMGALHLAEKRQHDTLFKQTLYSIKASEYYIANTRFEKNRLVEYGVKETQVKVTGCGIDMAHYEAASPATIRELLNIGDDIVIGYFGRHDKVKGIDVILNAFNVLAKSNKRLSLIIAGSASAYTGEIKDIIRSFDSNIQQKCFVLENVAEKDKPTVLHVFDLFVCPSVKESFGIVFLEAWACKKPVIGADIGAVRSVINHGEDGYLIKPDDTEELVTYCTALINDSCLRRRMGERGYNKVQQNYTLDVITAKYRAVYQSAINKYQTANETVKNVQAGSNMD